MKKLDMKGVSPVIATILLIALTVAAVGIVAVVLSTIGTPTPAPTVIISGAKACTFDNKLNINFTHSGGETLKLNELRVIVGCYSPGLEDTGKWHVYTADPLPSGSVRASDSAGATDVYIQPLWDPNVSVGESWSFEFFTETIPYEDYFPSTDDRGTIEVTIIHIPSNTQLFKQTNVPLVGKWW